jgi:hypothetical protein
MQKKVSDILPKTEILAQLAEEASELAQAALKLRRALDGIAATWGALIQNLRCDADLTDEQVQKIIRIGDRYWEMVGKFKEEDMTPDEFADYITAKPEQVEKELRERWS